MNKWKTVKDVNARLVWKCDDKSCQNFNKPVYVNPDYFQDNGTPMCECDLDLVYVRTEVK